MKALYLSLFFAIIATLSNPASTKAQIASVKIGGEVDAPYDLTLGDLKQFPQTTVMRKEKDGKEHSYTGVILATIVKKAGIVLGKDDKGHGLTRYVSVDASDGYRVIFALVELDKDFTDRTIILADTMDGKSLPAGDGPFRVIVQDEKKAGRCIKMVTAITVQLAK